MDDNKYRQISEDELKDLGIKTFLPEPIAENFDYHKRHLPPVVLAESLHSFSGMQDGKQVNYEQNKIYLMNLRRYRNIFYLGDVRLIKPANIKFVDVFNPYAGQDLTDKSILVWGTGGFGDLLMLEPCLRYLKKIYPTCKIILIFHSYHLIIEEWDFVDEIFSEALLPYELLLKTDYQAFFEKLIDTKYAEQENEYRLYSKWLGLNIPDEFLTPKLVPNQNSLMKAKAFLNKFGLKEKSFIIVQMMSLTIIRTPNPTIWKKIIDKLTSEGHKIIITDQPQKSEFINNFIDTLENKENVFNFAPYSASISDTIALASLAEMALSVDSALIHIAAALNIKAFGLYGPFPGNLRLETYKNIDWIDCKASCAPCFKHGYEPCINSQNNYPNCYENIDFNEVFTRIEKFLN